MAYINSENERVLPMLALRGLVVYPKMMVNFEIGRKKSIDAVEESIATLLSLMIFD